MFLRYFILLFFSVFFGFTQIGFCVSPPSKNRPWLTGPLLTPSSRVIKLGHANLEPYIFWTETTGKYQNDWHAISVPAFYQLNPQLLVKVGIHEKANLTFTLQSFYNRTKKTSSAGFGDLPLGFDIELVAPTEDNIPVKLTIQEVFPTGRYQHLNPSKLGTDAIGLGSFATGLAITISKSHHFSHNHFLNVRLNAAVTLPAPVHVKGLNSYGGSPTTRGKVFPGTSFALYLGAEYTLTKNWALALDLLGQFSAKNRFKGHTQIANNFPSSAQFSLAPAIEYNWSETLGVIVGSWFTVAGRNSGRFVSAVAAVNLYY